MKTLINKFKEIFSIGYSEPTTTVKRLSKKQVLHQIFVDALQIELPDQIGKKVIEREIKCGSWYIDYSFEIQIEKDKDPFIDTTHSLFAFLTGFHISYVVWNEDIDEEIYYISVDDIYDLIKPIIEINY